MRLAYLRFWTFAGVVGLDGEVDAVTLGKPPIEFMLTKDAERFLVHLDRAQALANEVPIDNGARVERVGQAIAAAREERAGRTAVYLIARAEMDVTEPRPRRLRDFGEFEVSLVGPDTDEIAARYQSSIDAFQIGMKLTLTQNVRALQELGSVIVLTPDHGKPVYVRKLRFSTIGPTVSIHWEPPPDLLNRTGDAARRLLKQPNLDRPATLLTSSISGAGGDLQAYLDAWTALEMFVNTAFKSPYGALWRAAIEEALPASAKPAVDRLTNVMTAKYRPTDKFLIVATMLDPEDAAGDAEDFEKLKGSRDKMFHGGGNRKEKLPSEAIRRLLLKYLDKHLRVRGPIKSR